MTLLLILKFLKVFNSRLNKDERGDRNMKIHNL